MRKRERFSPPAVGGSSLLVIFAVLCLTVFALLGLGSVLAEKRMADAAALTVSAYYEADCQAEEIFARLRNGETVEEVQQEGNHYRYACFISQNQELEVELMRENGGWKILRWQAVAQVEITEEDGPAVWDGGTP